MVALAAVVGLAALAPWCYAKTDPDMSAYSSTAGGTAFVVDMVAIPTEGLAIHFLLLYVNYIILFKSFSQEIKLKLYILQNVCPLTLQFLAYIRLSIFSNILNNLWLLINCLCLRKSGLLTLAYPFHTMS